MKNFLELIFKPSSILYLHIVQHGHATCKSFRFILFKSMYHGSFSNIFKLVESSLKITVSQPRSSNFPGKSFFTMEHFHTLLVMVELKSPNCWHIVADCYDHLIFQCKNWITIFIKCPSYF